MIVLALDTAHEFGSIALARGEETLDEVLLHAPDGFSGVLFEQIAKVLERNGMPLESVDVFAAGAGPGSFTGIRIGLAAVKGLAETRGKRCYGISNLAAMAEFGSGASRAVILDARRGEVYGGLFRCEGSVESVSPLPDWLGSVQDEVDEFLAFDFGPFEGALASSRWSEVTRTRVPRAIARSIAKIALRRLREGGSGDPALVDANYVRRSDAELLWLESKPL